MIPVLDLRDWRGADPARRRAFARELRGAFEQHGFVAVEGHGVDPALQTDAYALFERFFALPEATKRESSGSAGGARGFTPFSVEHAKDHPVPDLKEFFHVGRELSDGHAREAQYPPNRWPAALPELRAIAVGLYDQLDRCAGVLLEALAEAYGLPQRTFAAMLEEGNSILRALHYPPVSPDAPADALRAAPHEDINLITLLCQASDAGLEILGTDGLWRSVDAASDQIVVDSGDMLSRVTGGVIPATTHRVTNPPGAASRHRYSMPFFAHPAPECDLSVLEAFATPERLAAHPPITAGRYLDERLREIGLMG